MKTLSLLFAVVIVVAGCASAKVGANRTSLSCAGATRAETVTPGGQTPVAQWLAHTPLYVAHRGGDADWVEGTADAYRKAAAWNPDVALEVPVRLTADGVWVVSEDATTGRVFNQNYNIRSSTWAVLSRLSSRRGSYPMARLVDDVLIPYGSRRILFIDNKANARVPAFFDLLDSYAGRTRYVSKSYYASVRTAAEARRRGYLTWAYYYDRDMTKFAATQSRFDLLGLNFSAPARDFAIMTATGKRVIAHIVANQSSAASAAGKGANGFMVSGVEEVVPRPSGSACSGPVRTGAGPRR